MRHAHDHRAGEAAARAVAQARGVVHHLVDAGIQEAGELDLRHRAQPVGGHADGGAHDHRLRERRVDDPAGAELRQEPFRDPEDPAILADILAEQDDPVIARHLLP